MKATGIKFVYMHSNGEANTWHDVFEETVEDIVNKGKRYKDWGDCEGKFTEIYIEFDNGGNYYKVQLDVKPYNKLIKCKPHYHK